MDWHPLLFTYLVQAVDPANPINVIIAGLAFLNTLGIFGLIYHVGSFVGTNNQRWMDTDKKLAALDTALSAIRDQAVLQVKSEVVLSQLKTVIETEMKAEIQLLRKRSHEMANMMLRIALGERPQLPEDLKGE